MSDGNKVYRSTCSYCGVGCGILIKKDHNGKLTVEGDKDYPVNKGMLCSKGMNLHHVVADKNDRLVQPQMRWAKNLPMVNCSWDQALDKVTATVKTIVDKYGPDSFGFYVSGQCLTEEYYLVNKIAKGFIGTNNVDTNSRLCMSSAVVGYKLALGEDAVPVSYDDIELADCFFITGANPAWCHPILFRRIEAHKQANPNVKIIVADPRKTQTCAQADLHLQIKPGTDIWLNNAIAKCLLDKGYVDIDFVEKFTEGFGELAKHLGQFSVIEAAARCDVAITDIELAAKWIGDAKGFITMWAMGLNQSVVGVNKNLSLLNLSVMTGKIGKPGNGPFSLTGQPNAMGGREVGGMANLLPAHRNLDNPEHRNEVAQFWGVESVPAKPGYTATEMFEAILQDELKVIWIICTNPLVSLPNARLVEKALKKARLVIVQDISGNSITTHYADVVLPAAGWLEKEGTMTNSDRRISLLSKVVDAPGEAWSDQKILVEFANRMGFKGFKYKNAEAIFNEHRELTAGTNIDIAGLGYDFLKKHGSAQWPFPKGAESGTERLFTDNKFYTPSEKAKLFNVPEENLSEKPSRDFPLVLTTGRIRDQWHTMTRTGKVNKLNQHIAEPFIEIHPVDAQKRGIVNGDLVNITNKNGDVRVKAVITSAIKEGVVFLPMHWGKILNKDFVRANNLTNTLVDSRSKEPDYKYTVVQVEKYKKPKEKIVIVGAGAGACKFVEEYRKLNQEDEIVVFSKEKNPFYNRVLLPEYYTGHKSWENLVKLNANAIELLNVKVHTGKEILGIDVENKVVKERSGKECKYDKLILATGSRPNLPSNVQVDYKGIFSIRNREDADRLKEYMHNRQSVTVVGGGLLGLEIASSLWEAGLKVTIVHRNARLMDKQLDKESSAMLGDIIEEKGIDLMMNDEIERVVNLDEAGANYNLMFRSGRFVNTDAIVYAIGTIPNVDFVKQSSVQVRRGVVVNGRLETNAKDIYAIGEIAEYQGRLFGITLAAEQQAEVVVKSIFGNYTANYQGTVLMNILKFPGVELCSIGLTQAPENEGYEEILFIDRAQRFYKKCIIYNDRLVGAILMGDKSEFGEFKELIEKGNELSEKRLTLLRSGQKAKPVIGKVVCSCNNVGEGNILEVIEAGTIDFLKVCQETGAGTGCGSCKPEVQSILKTALIKSPVA